MIRTSGALFVCGGNGCDMGGVSRDPHSTSVMLMFILQFFLAMSVYLVSTLKSLRCTEPGGEIHSMQMTSKMTILLH